VIGGDLDDAPLPPEVFVVWENLLGIPGPRFTEKRFRRRVRWNASRSALDLFEDTNGLAVAELWRLWQRDVPVVLVTFLPEELAGDLAARVAAESIPHSRLVVSTPTDMARQIGLLGTAYIFHALPDHVLRYGPKGIYVRPDSPEIMREVA
jgi:hypothetical protein